MPSSKPEQKAELFKPGDTVHPGVYQAVDHSEHRAASTIVLKRREKFPGCRRCEHTVFLLVHAALHFSEDPDLSKPR